DRPLGVRGSATRRSNGLATLPLHNPALAVARHLLRAAHRHHQLVPGVLTGTRACPRRRTAQQRRGAGVLPLSSDLPGVQVRTGCRGVLPPVRHRAGRVVAATALRGETSALRMSYRLGRFFGRSASYVLLIVLSTATVFPFIWMVATSLKSTQEIFAYPPTFWPQELHWENFRTVL